MAIEFPIYVPYVEIRRKDSTRHASGYLWPESEIDHRHQLDPNVSSDEIVAVHALELPDGMIVYGFVDLLALVLPAGHPAFTTSRLFVLDGKQERFRVWRIL